jgi:hypothetical protein
MNRVRRLVTPLVASCLVVSLGCGAALAAWSVGSVPGGHGTGAAATVNAGSTPTAVVDGNAITVSWVASTLSTGEPVTGYLVKRYDATTLIQQTILTACTGTVTTTSCTERSVPPGHWSFSITPILASLWRGAESPKSTAVDSGAGLPALGMAASFSVLGATGVTNGGPSHLSGDLGVSPSSAVTGFPAGVVAGTIHAADSVAAQAQADLVLAYNDAATRAATGTFAGDQNGATFHPGTYHTAAAFALTGNLTLDGDGNPNAIFIFQVDAALNTAAASTVTLVNGARAANVFWQVNGAAGTGAPSTFSGTIMAAGAITLGAGSLLIGRALSRGAVTLADNTIRFTVALPPTVSIVGGATDVTKNPTRAITGSTNAPPSTAVSVTVVDQVLAATVQSDGSWSVTPSALIAGAHVINVSIRDGAGNVGTATQTLTVEINPAPVLLNSAGTYSVLGATGVTSAGLTSLTGDLGVSPSSAILGFPPGTVAGTTHAGDSQAAQAQLDLTSAYDDVAARIPHATFAGDVNGRTFHDGIYRTDAAFTLTGAMTLDAENDPNAFFIFQVHGALNTAAGSTVNLVNGAQASHVFWQVTGAVTTGAPSSFGGTIMAAGAITLGAGAQLAGRALSFGLITLAANAITAP